MQILVLTVYNSFNFGAFLQAYAMEKYLNSRGHEVDFLCMDPHNYKFHKKYYKTKNPLRLIRRIQTEVAFNRDQKAINVVDSISKTYDLAIIGSDELWNVKNDGFSHRREYVGLGIHADKIITYAVSCNKSVASDFTKAYPYPKLFTSLDSIAVRDRMTEKLVKDIDSSREVERVLDPTFLFDFKKERHSIKKDYILVYGYRFLDSEVDAIKQYAHKMKLPLYAIGFEQSWCDKYINCGPISFLDYMYSAHSIITATFHGTVFSIIFNKDFVSFGRDNSKVLDLLLTFDLDNRNATDNDMLKIFESGIDYAAVNRKIEKYRNDSFAYLYAMNC